MIGNMMIGRRRLLTISATGVSALALGTITGTQDAHAAEDGALGFSARHR